jgi:HlyD family secretion protein
MATAPKRKKTLLIGLILLALLLVGLAAWKARQKPKGEEVTMEKVQRRTLKEMVSASGKIFPETEVKISSDVSGEIIALFVREGDSVQAGQLLARIQPDLYETAVARSTQVTNAAAAQRNAAEANVKSIRARIDQLKANRKAAVARMENTKAIYSRNEKLLKEGVVSRQEYDISLSNFQSSEGEVAGIDASIAGAESDLASSMASAAGSGFNEASNRLTLKEQRTNLQRTEIRAPVNGIVSKLNVEKGERVVGTLQMAGTEMMRIANLTSMEVQVDVSENDIMKLAVNDEADIEIDAYLGRKFKGKVTEIANSASNVGTGSIASLNTDQVTNFIVKIRVDQASYADLVAPNKSYPFRPGMSASVDVYTHTADNVLSVPIIAVTAREDKKEEDKKKDDDDAVAKTVKQPIGIEKIKEIVFVVSNDTVGIREVKTGIQDNDHIEVLSGLAEGDVIVSGPYSAIARKLKSGTRIMEQKKDKAKKKSEE